MSDDPTLEAARRQIVQASRILAHRGIVDAYGHVSVRHPLDPDRLLICRSRAPALVTVEDVMTLDGRGEPLPGDARRPFLERYIHSEIYRSRPDVGAVVHSHSHAVLPFAAVPEASLRPIFHMAGFIGGAVPVFEIRECAGEANDLLIRSPELGAALAAQLKDASAILMRGHGSTCVGVDVRQAVYRAIYLEANARIQMDAQRLGQPVFLNADEAGLAAAANDSQIGRAWEAWVQEACTEQERL